METKRIGRKLVQEEDDRDEVSDHEISAGEQDSDEEAKYGSSLQRVEPKLPSSWAEKNA
jgi:hypothetical protein